MYNYYNYTTVTYCIP